MRFNEWQKIGLVVSVIWTIAAVLAVTFEANNDAANAMLEYRRQCRELSSSPATNFAHCHEIGRCVANIHGAVWPSTLAMLLPIPLTWAAAYVIAWALDFIRSGIGQR